VSVVFQKQLDGLTHRGIIISDQNLKRLFHKYLEPRC
jgi:hypothetical protein